MARDGDYTADIPASPCHVWLELVVSMLHVRLGCCLCSPGRVLSAPVISVIDSGRVDHFVSVRVLPPCGMTVKNCGFWLVQSPISGSAFVEVFIIQVGVCFFVPSHFTFTFKPHHSSGRLRNLLLHRACIAERQEATESQMAVFVSDVTSTCMGLGMLDLCGKLPSWSPDRGTQRGNLLACWFSDYGEKRCECLAAFVELHNDKNRPSLVSWACYFELQNRICFMEESRSQNGVESLASARLSALIRYRTPDYVPFVSNSEFSGEFKARTTQLHQFFKLLYVPELCASTL